MLAATNSWLHAQTRQSQYYYERDRGYVCTISAIVIKSTTAHIFHIGDSRIYRTSGIVIEQLTEDHRVIVSSEQNYLSRALGVNPQIEIDYQQLQIEKGDIFILATDGVYEHVDAKLIAGTILENASDLDKAAKILVEAAYRQNSADNLTVQIVRIDEIPQSAANEVYAKATELPLPPFLDARMVFDGYRIVRELHSSSRSHIYLAVDTETENPVAIKIPSVDLRDDPAYIRRFVMEEWIAKRINSPYVLKAFPQTRRRNFLYVAMEFVEGQTLTQWMIDNPNPDLEIVRGIVEQIAQGLRAFHRMEMLHQDLRPENIIIDKTGTAKIIDFGSTEVAGVSESSAFQNYDILGTVQYTAPEYFLGENTSPRSDLFSLAVITYQMLAGKLPFGAAGARARTKAEFKKLKYRPANERNKKVPVWIDGVLKKALSFDPYKRHEALSEFLFDLRHPNSKYAEVYTPLVERNPLLFWKIVSLILAFIVLLQLVFNYGFR